MCDILNIISLITGCLSIVLAIISIWLSIKMNKETDKLLKEIRKVALENKESIGIVNNDLSEI